MMKYPWQRDKLLKNHVTELQTQQIELANTIAIFSRVIPDLPNKQKQFKKFYIFPLTDSFSDNKCQIVLDT